MALARYPNDNMLRCGKASVRVQSPGKKQGGDRQRDRKKTERVGTECGGKDEMGRKDIYSGR